MAEEKTEHGEGSGDARSGESPDSAERGASEEERRMIMRGERPDVAEPAEDVRDRQEEHEELAQRLERTQEEVQELEEAHGEKGSRLTRAQLVHDAAIMTRTYYGKEKRDFNEEGRFEVVGWYNLVDLWLMIPMILENEYHGRFRRYATILGWGSRLNSHLIPNQYLISMAGVDKALNDNIVDPLATDRWKYRLLVKTSIGLGIAGPPLGWFDSFGPSREQARIWVKQDILGELPPDRQLVEEDRRFEELKNRLEEVEEEVKDRKERYQTAKKKLQEVRKEGGDVEKWRKMQEYEWMDYQQKLSDLRRVYDKYRRAKEAREELES